MEKKTYFVEDEIITNEIDDLSYYPQDSEIVIDDPFTKVSFDNLSLKMKRKINKLSKKFEGEDGTKSKWIDPLTLDGYTLYDVVTPPYDLDILAGLYDSSAIHNASIAARVMNTVGLGFEFVENMKAKRKLKKHLMITKKCTGLEKLFKMKKKSWKKSLKI